MKNILGFLSQRAVSGIILTAISGLTVFTSVAGVIKVAGSISGYKPKIPEVKTVQSALQEEGGLLSKANPSPTQKPSSALKPAAAKSTSNTILPSPTKAPSTTASSVNNNGTNNNGCIITLFGKQYDVTTLQNTHSGGNVFQCGTDQTALYQSQHGTDISRMQPYLVTGGTTGSSTNTSSSGKTSIKADDDVESENEERDFHQEKEDKNETESNELSGD